MSKKFITISKFNRGSMTPEEIQFVLSLFKENSYLSYTRIFIVNEHQNRKKEPFEHLHVFICFKKDIVHDVLRRNLKKYLGSLYQHQKDLDVRDVPNENQLIGGYMMKTSDVTILLKEGFSDETWQSILETVEEVDDFHQSLKNIKVNRIPKHDLPYVLFEYISKKSIQYNCSLYLFKEIIYKIRLDGYDFEVKGKMLECKAKLDLMFGNKTLMNSLIDEDFNFHTSPLQENCDMQDKYAELLKY